MAVVPAGPLGQCPRAPLRLLELALPAVLALEEPLEGQGWSRSAGRDVQRLLGPFAVAKVLVAGRPDRRCAPGGSRVVLECLPGLPAPSSSGPGALSGPPWPPRSGRPAPRCRRSPCRRGGRPARAARASAPRGQVLGRGDRRQGRRQPCDRRGGQGPAGDHLGRRRRLDGPPGCPAFPWCQAAPHALPVGRRQALGPDRAAGAQRPGRRVVGPGAVLAVLGVEGRRSSSPAGRLLVPGRPPQLDHAPAR